MGSIDIRDLCLTFVFQDKNDFHHSYQLAYHPCPVWMRGSNDHIIPMPDSVNYEYGSFEMLLKYIKESHYIEFEHQSKCILIADKGWLSFNEELNKIVDDVTNNGFGVSLITI
jgi:hypothetical protein